MKPDALIKRKWSCSSSSYEEVTSKRAKESPLPSPDKEQSGRRSNNKEMLAVEKVTACHILVKHSESRRKASWKDPEGVEIKKTPRHIALEKLTGARKEIVDRKKKFEDVARKLSDCSSAKRGGSLG